MIQLEYNLISIISMSTLKLTVKEIIDLVQQLPPQEQDQIRQAMTTHQQQREQTPIKQRIPDLYPDAIIIDDDFNAPLPDEFWLGEE